MQSNVIQMLQNEIVNCAGKHTNLETIILFEVKQAHKDETSVYVSYVNVNFETFYRYV